MSAYIHSLIVVVSGSYLLSSLMVGVGVLPIARVARIPIDRWQAVGLVSWGAAALVAMSVGVNLV